MAAARRPLGADAHSGSDPGGATVLRRSVERGPLGGRELARRGARAGERVAIALPPGIEFAQALHACFLLGAVAVPVDLRLTLAERERIVAGGERARRAPLARGASQGTGRFEGRQGRRY